MKKIKPQNKNKKDNLFEKTLQNAWLNQDGRRYEVAINLYKEATKLRPENYLARINLGVCYAALGQFTESCQILHKLHENYPTDLKVMDLCSKIYFQNNQFDVAIKFLKRIINLDDTNFQAWLSLAKTASANGQDIEALAYATKAIELQPANAAAHSNLGAALIALNKFEEAAYCLETALKIDPTNINSLSNLAGLNAKLGQHLKAIAQYEVCEVKLKPGSVELSEIQFKKSFSLLAIGELEKGWICYDQGFAPKSKHARMPQRKFICPKWDGEFIKGKKLLIWREQGLGDEIMYASIIEDALPYCENIIIECSPRLVSLFQRSFPSCEVRIQKINAMGENFDDEDYDFHIPMGSLAFLFRKHLNSFPKRKSYLYADPLLKLKMQDRLSAYKSKKLIGICWRSGTLNAQRNLGYTALSDWEIFLKNPEFQIVNLQYSSFEDELIKAEKIFDCDILRWSDIDLKDDQESLAALISCLDCVVSAGTAVAPMAGSLGVPLYLFGHKSWASLGSNQYPWYPSCHFFEVKKGEAASTVLPGIFESISNQL